MKIIKRNGSEAVFDITKIIAAITKANKVVPDAQRLTKQQIIEISDHVQEVCYARGHAMNVEEIQDIVEDAIMATGAYEVARRYITYRYVQSLKRTHNTTDDKILSLIECNNEEVKQENSNKNPTVNSVQRDYMAGEVSKDLTMRMLLPPEIVKAHEEGIIHFHDADYYAQHMHNCDLVNLDDMLQNGTVISGTLIEKPHSFSTACNIATQIIAQVASSQYGGQSVDVRHLGKYLRKSYNKYKKRYTEEFGDKIDPDTLEKLITERLKDELKSGVQTIQYQVVTLMTTNGQAPFITVFMYLGEARSEQEQKDLAIIIEETLRQRIEEIRRKAPAVHADGRIVRQTAVHFAILREQRAVAAGDNVRALAHLLQEAELVDRAHAARHIAVLRQRVFQRVADHEVLAALAPQRPQVLIRQLERARAVVIVRVDDEKRRIEEFAAAQHRVPRAPRLHAPFRDGKALRQLIQLLEGVVCFHPRRHARTDHRLEGIFNLVLNQEHDAAEARLVRIVQAVIEDDLAVRADRIQLLQSPVAAAHARRHHHQNRFFHG